MFRHLFIVVIFLFKGYGSELPYETVEWASLFHVINHKQSDISDNSFYLSKERTLSSEYSAALLALDKDDANITLCRYPARYRYLSKTLDLNLSFGHCENFIQFLNESKGDEASISFASAYLESPMSYFGHTFITIHKPQNRFFSQTVSFAAEVPEKTGFLELASKGIGGGFSGKFVAAPYFKLFEGYNMVEQRAISEYRLNLTKEEIENLLWHVYELYDISVDYKFLTNNCAFETLWLLEVARPGINLVSQFNGIVPPYETIETLKQSGVIGEIKTQPSSIESIFAIYSKLNQNEKSFFKELKEKESKSKEIQISLLSDSSKDKMGYLINGYYDLLFKRYRIGKSDFDDVKAIPYTPHSEFVSGETLRGGGSKIEFGFQENDSTDWIVLSLKPYSVNRIEDRFSILSDATLEILNLTLATSSHNQRIESFTLFNLESYTKRFDFYKPLSWKMKIGSDHTLDDTRLSSMIQFGIGGSWGDENFLAYLVPQFTFYPEYGISGTDITSGMGLWFGNTHVGIDYMLPLIYSSKDPDANLNAYISFQIATSTLKVSKDSDAIRASLVYVF